MVNEPDQNRQHPMPRRDWLDWPPTPRMQIALIVAACGLINIILIAVWAYVMYTR